MFSLTQQQKEYADSLFIKRLKQDCIEEAKQKFPTQKRPFDSINHNETNDSESKKNDSESKKNEPVPKRRKMVLVRENNCESDEPKIQECYKNTPFSKRQEDILLKSINNVFRSTQSKELDYSRIFSEFVELGGNARPKTEEYPRKQQGIKIWCSNNQEKIDDIIQKIFSLSGYTTSNNDRLKKQTFIQTIYK